MIGGTDTAYALAKKYQVKLAWGTDTLFSAELAGRQGAQLTKMVRWFTPAEVLKMATHDNAELLALSGPRNPYPGKLGVVEEGALADLLLVDGDPLADIALLNDPREPRGDHEGRQDLQEQRPPIVPAQDQPSAGSPRALGRPPHRFDQASSRRSPSAMSAVAPHRKSAASPAPRPGSKSSPGVTATPASRRIRAAKARLSPVIALTSA